VLDLLASRLPTISDEARRASQPSIVKILRFTRKKPSTHNEGAFVPAACNAMKAIALSMSPGEEGPLADCIPMILAAIRDRAYIAPAMPVIVPLPWVYGFVLHGLMSLMRVIEKSWAHESSHTSETLFRNVSPCFVVPLHVRFSMLISRHLSHFHSILEYH
jgi:hypothetical protein